MTERIRGRIIENTPDVSERIKIARQRLDDFLQTYPDADVNKYPHMSVNWSRRWEKYRKCYGDGHLITLFPRDTSKNTSHWNSTLNLLSRTIDKRDGFGIETKMDLVCTPDSELVQENHYSAKTLKLIDLMRGVARAELNLINLKL
jgi:hypothetical protein